MGIKLVLQFKSLKFLKNNNIFALFGNDSKKKLIQREFIFSSIQVSNVLVLTVRCKLINFVFQIFPLFIPEMPAGFMSYIVQIISLVWLGSCNHCNLACFL
jgi:hypothetical protein